MRFAGYYKFAESPANSPLARAPPAPRSRAGAICAGRPTPDNDAIDEPAGAPRQIDARPLDDQAKSRGDGEANGDDEIHPVAGKVMLQHADHHHMREIEAVGDASEPLHRRAVKEVRGSRAIRQMAADDEKRPVVEILAPELRHDQCDKNRKHDDAAAARSR